jgi:hypothetical protein
MAGKTMTKPKEITEMYEVIPSNDAYKLRNIASNRDVVSGISRESAIRLKNQLERQLRMRVEDQNEGSRQRLTVVAASRTESDFETN